jgi:allantoicase
MVWNTLLPRSKLSPHCLVEFCDLEENDDASFVKLTMIPDGGISRLRVIGSW